MDDRGYLIAHPGLIDPTGKGPAEQRHITHMVGFVLKKIYYWVVSCLTPLKNANTIFSDQCLLYSYCDKGHKQDVIDKSV